MSMMRPEMTRQKGRRVRKTIQELRDARGESRPDLAAAIGVTLDEVTAWEMGRAEPGVSRLRVLSEHFGVRDDQINLKPGQAPTLGERLADAF
jgi:transcriptional regulator with XRE-family HTH domain